MQDEAKRLGYTLVETNANEQTDKQIADVASLIAQKVDILIFPPRESQALAPSVLQAKAAGIPVILIDRDVDHSIAKPGEDYITFIGSDFVDQGRRAAEWLVKATDGKAKIIELEGTTGADPAIERKKGFDEYLQGSFKGTPTPEGAYPDMEIIASQTGNFLRDTGREVMQTLLQAHPDVTAVYAHNDEMAIGAIAALQEAGRKPGEDVIIVSIDGENAALDAIVDGTLGATVESSPFFGPIAFKTMQQYIDGEDIPDWVKVEDRFFDKSNAAEFQGKQF
jgi:ribose transport system substrate-binding protein